MLVCRGVNRATAGVLSGDRCSDNTDIRRCRHRNVPHDRVNKIGAKKNGFELIDEPLVSTY
jgi:hypothetical protein